MDEATSDREARSRIRMPMGASIVIAVVVLAIAAFTLKSKRAS